MLSKSSIAEVSVSFISALSQQCMRPTQLAFEGIRLFPSNREITTRCLVFCASSYNCLRPARSAAVPLVTPQTQINPCNLQNVHVLVIFSNVGIKIYFFLKKISLRFYNQSEMVLYFGCSHVTSSVRLISIPNLSSPCFGVNSTNFSSNPGKNHSLIPCII